MDKQIYESEYDSDETEENETNSKFTHSRLKKIFLLSGIIFIILLLIFAWLIFTKSGRRIIYKIAGSVIYQGLDKDDDIEASSVIVPLEKQPQKNNKEKVLNKDNNKNGTVNKLAIPMKRTEPRSEDYVNNYLIFGIEEFDGAKNADAIMIISINTRDNTIKLMSLLRDTYIETEDNKPNKLNAFFSIGGAKKLVEVIENNYRIKIDGYAYINFESFEKTINYLGGISIELSEEEAEYLNTTNYISNPAYRTVQPGWNLLNGNQTLGYCRIRMVKTLGGAGDDYGRTLRQRRVLKAIYNKYKSKGLIDLLLITNNALRYVKTNVTQGQIEKALEDIIENKISNMETMRLPVNGAFDAPVEYNGIGYPLVYDWDTNIIELYRFLYLDSEEEALKNLEKYR